MVYCTRFALAVPFPDFNDHVLAGRKSFDRLIQDAEDKISGIKIVFPNHVNYRITYIPITEYATSESIKFDHELMRDETRIYRLDASHCTEFVA